MPVISMFYGLIVRMFFFDTDKHHVAHVHIQYAEFNAVFSIAEGAVLAGELPAGKVRLAQAWIEIHREELLADWTLAVEGQEVFKIEPLR